MADTVLGSILTTSTITVNSAPVRSAIDTKDDVDFWRISLIAGVRYTFSLSSESKLDSVLRIFNSSGYAFLNNDDYDWPRLNYEQIFYTPTVSGDYYISTSSWNGYTYGYYDLSVTSKPTVSIKSSVSWVNEGNQYGGVYTFTVERSDGTGTASVNWAVAHETTSASDFSGATNGVVKFAANEVSKKITINIVGDTFKEADEKFNIVLSNAVGFTINHGTSGGVIRNDDSDYILGGAGTTSALTIGGAVVQSSVDFSTDQDWWKVSLVAGTTYTFNQNSANGSPLNSYLRLLNSAGAQLAYNDNSVIFTDNSAITYKATTTGTYYLSAQGAGESIGGYTLAGVVAQPVISISSTIANVQKNEGSNISMPFTFTVSRSNGNGLSTVNYSIAGAASGDQGAASASDFSNSIAPSGFMQMPSGTVTFAPGQTSQTITVGVVGDTAVERNERFSVTLSDPVNATLGTSVDYGVIKNDDVATKNSADIFRAAGLVNGDGATDGIETGKIRVMADFSKAAYALQPWETSTRGGNIINDVSPLADQALNQIKAQGWVPVDLSPNLSANSIIDDYRVNNQMASGFYTNGNAAALVARSADAVVISIRGTNDNAEQYSPNQNNADNGNYIYPDVDQWGQPFDPSSQSMLDHYLLLTSVLGSLDQYVKINDIQKVYVTGHSLGGAVALVYADEHRGDNIFETVTFAAPGFTINGRGNPMIFNSNNRVLQIEVDEDPVPATWTVAAPGKIITFYGNKTGDEPDDLDIGNFNSDNHSMDYYLQIAYSVDAFGWKKILSQPDDVKIAIGGKSGYKNGSNVPDFDRTPVRHDPTQQYDQFDNYFIVDGRDSRTGAPLAGQSHDLLQDAWTDDYDIYYGGVGNDTVMGTTASEIILGGSGNDLIVSVGGHDEIYGGGGNDVFKFITPWETGDVFADFQSGLDKIQVVGRNFGLSSGKLVANRFVSGVNPKATTPDAVFLYDTSTGALFFDSNGNAAGPLSALATLTGSRLLVAGDIQVVDA